MTFTTSKLLMLIALLFAALAVMAVLFGVDNAKVYPASIAASLAFAWASFIVP